MSFSPTLREVSHSPTISSRIKSPVPEDSIAIDMEGGAFGDDEDISTITPGKHARGHSHSHSTDSRGFSRSHSHSHSHDDHAHSHSHDLHEEAEETLAKNGYNHNHHSHDHSDEGHGAGGHSHGNMNMHALLLHVLGDALGNVGVIASGLIIWLTEWKGKYYSDPIISLVITCIIFASALPLGQFRAFSLFRFVAVLTDDGIVFCFQ